MPIGNTPRSQCCCFSGHRPEKLAISETAITDALHREILLAISAGYVTFITGMARGVDLLAAELVLRERAHNPALRLVCALPYTGFGDHWAEPWRGLYRRVLSEADGCAVFADAYRPDSYMERNRWMVDHADRLIAVYSGEAGGTLNTIKYAVKAGVQIRPIFTHSR